METVQKEGNREVKRKLEFYNLDSIIAEGYRVNSHRATQFRIWATKILKECIIKGFAMDEYYLKNPDNQAEVKKIEREIDLLVYKLYELTEDEIKIVEDFCNK